MNTKTPRTDAVASHDGNWDTKALRMMHHARELERGLNEARKEAERWRDCFQTGMSMQVKSPSKVFPWEEKQSPNSKPWLNEAAALGKETRKKEESS